MRHLVFLLLCSLVLLACKENNNPRDDDFFDSEGVAAGGISNTSGTATGLESSEVVRNGEETTPAPRYQLRPLSNLPGGVLDDAAMVAIPGRRVLLTGGFRTGNTVGAEAYLYTASTKTWKAVAPMSVARRSHVLVLMNDGRVLAAGGVDAMNQELDSAEIYDPATEIWSATGSMVAARAFHTAVSLDDDRVLVIGGLFGVGPAAEAFDPITGLFSGIAGNPVAERAAVKLNDGRVLIPGSTTTTAAIFDPTTDSFSTVGPMSSPHGFFPTATLLSDGRVLVAGGQGNLFETNETDIFEPGSDTFSAGPTMNLNRGAHAAMRLASGEVLVVGGQDNGTVHATAEFWDLQSPTFTVVPGLPAPRMSLVAVAFID